MKVCFFHLLISFMIFGASGQFNICTNPSLSLTSGNISSPNYPQDYSNDLNCTTQITVPSDRAITITFLDFDIQSHAKCALDELRVYDGAVLYTSKGFCGTQKPRDFVAHNHTVTFNFKTDSTNVARGFLIQWTTNPRCAADQFTCWNGVCIPRTQQCDGVTNCDDDSDEIECARSSTNFSECGRSDIAPQFLWDTRIVGGNEATVGSWPWQVRLAIKTADGTGLCGGSILNAEWIVTAAHCTEDALSHTSVIVYAGQHSTTQNSEFQNRTSMLLINHENYNSATLVNDISLIKLQTPLVFTSTIRPICLPSDTPTFDVPDGTICIATGWGTLASDHNLPNELHQVRLPIVGQSTCSRAYANLPSTNICAGNYEKGGVDSCQGDSGGPLACLIDNTNWYLIGVTSYGIGCGDVNFPGVYTRVSMYESWIRTNAQFYRATTDATASTETQTTSTTFTPSTLVLNTLNTSTDTTGQFNICTNPSLSITSGNISSPNYPQNYSNDLNCTTRITAPSDQAITITFLDFDVENHDTCAYDELRIYDGAVLYTSIGFCGTQKPRDFVAHNPTVTLNFKTDHSHVARGFLIQWTTNPRCAVDQFTCWNGVCIPNTQQCDGVTNCGDDSDEIECARPSTDFSECGRSDAAPQFLWDTRIVGGNEAIVGSWPWQVRLLIETARGTALCGGSILNAEWIVTAAHCTEDALNNTSVTVYAGQHSTTQMSEFQNRTSILLINHENYNSATLVNDISLIKLQTPLVFTSTIRPICLPSDTPTFDVPDGTICIATGWGTLASDHNLPNELHQVRLPIVGQSTCSRAYANLPSTNICAGNYEKGGVDSCQGDSGGPLACLIDNTNWYLIGVTSYGIGCGDVNFPGVYTRVSMYESWIRTNAQFYRATTDATASTETQTTSTTFTPSTLVLNTLNTSTDTTGQFNICTNPSLSITSGNISSPNYPQNYSNDLNCTTRITAPSDQAITITFLDFDVENHDTCAYDELRIYDGAVLYTSIGFCGTQKPRDFVAHNPTVTLNFKTDHSHVARGFLIQWTTNPRCAVDQFTCWNGVCIPNTQQCDGVTNCGDDSDEIECARPSTNFSECGRSDAAPQFLWDTRIVGGNEAIVGSWPWQVRLSIATAKGTGLCGGSILNAEWIVTAAHCTEDALSNTSVTVYAGQHSTTQRSEFQNRTSILLIDHENYNNITVVNDISLIKLETPLVFTSTIRPICLPSDTSTFAVPDGTICIATGWGTLASDHILPIELHQVRLPIVGLSTCSRAYGTLPSTNICAGNYEKGGVDSCQGDSGGPLACLIDNTNWYLIGVTSYGIGCGDVNFPGVYTRVSMYESWIRTNAQFYQATTDATVNTEAQTTSTSMTVSEEMSPGPISTSSPTNFTASTLVLNTLVTSAGTESATSNSTAYRVQPQGGNFWLTVIPLTVIHCIVVYLAKF